MDKEQVKKQAKQILDKFAEALNKIEKEEKHESHVDREKFERIEGEGRYKDSNFKKKILQNSPEHDEDFILVEKGSWKQ